MFFCGQKISEATFNGSRLKNKWSIRFYPISKKDRRPSEKYALCKWFRHLALFIYIYCQLAL